MKLYYKYLPIGRLTYLDDELLRFSQPIDLNDPFECLPQKPNYKEYYDLVKDIASHLDSKKINGVSNPELDDSFREFTNEYLESIKSGKLDLYNDAYNRINKEIGIFSLSKNWNNTLMWSHYTDSHKGVCIGFNSEDEYFKRQINTDGTKFKLIADVVYSESRAKIPMILGQQRPLLKPYLTKSLDWKYEEEVRMLSTLNLSDKILPNIPVDINLFKIPHTIIKEIILGARISENDVSTIKVFCKKNGINLYQSKISDEKFDMDRDRIN